MKKRSKLLIIAVAFALALTMIPMSGLAAYADDSSTEVSSVDLTVEKLLCGTKIGNGEIPQPQVPELSSRFSARPSTECLHLTSSCLPSLYRAMHYISFQVPDGSYLIRKGIRDTL